MPIAPPRFSKERQTATQVPTPAAMVGELSLSVSVAAFVLRGTGRSQVPASSVERDTRTSGSMKIVPPRSSVEDHTAAQCPNPFVAMWGFPSAADTGSLGAFPLSAAAGLQLTPLSIDWAIRMSLSRPMVSPRLSFDCQIATHLPPAVASWGLVSGKSSPGALLFSAAGDVQKTPSLVERATRMSSSGPRPVPRVALDCQTVTQLTAPSVAICGTVSCALEGSPPAFAFR